MVCARMIYIYIYAAFTQYPNRYLYPTFSESDSYRIRYSLFVSVTESIRIRICIRTLSVSESEQKYENKYNMSDIRSYPIRFHPYLLPKLIMLVFFLASLVFCKVRAAVTPWIIN